MSIDTMSLGEFTSRAERICLHCHSEDVEHVVNQSDSQTILFHFRCPNCQVHYDICLKASYTFCGSEVDE